MPVTFQAGEDSIGNITEEASVQAKTSLESTDIILLRPPVRHSATTSIIKSDRKHAADKNPTVATSNPPSKPPLKPAVIVRARGPRFGLVQWQRLVRSSEDLAQRKGAPLREHITWEEIKQHNQPHDCWIVLKGVVYNIGPYLAYHPGGQEIFSKAKLLGADGTKLYDKYHPWVNIDGLIGTLAIGTVVDESKNSKEQDAPASTS